MAGDIGGVNAGDWGMPLWLGKKFSLCVGMMKADDSSGVSGKPLIGGDIGSFIKQALSRCVVSFLGLDLKPFNWSCDLDLLLLLDSLVVGPGSITSTLAGSLPPLRSALSGTVNFVFVTTVCTRSGELSLSRPSPKQRRYKLIE